MNWICKRLGIVYLPPVIDSSCCNRFPNSDDLLWMVYYWRKKNGISQVRDHMWNIYTWLPIIPRLCRFATPSFNAAEKVRSWWRTWVWPLQNHPFMVVNVETTWGDNIHMATTLPRWWLREGRLRTEHGGNRVFQRMMAGAVERVRGRWQESREERENGRGTKTFGEERES